MVGQRTDQHEAVECDKCVVLKREKKNKKGSDNNSEDDRRSTVDVESDERNDGENDKRTTNNEQHTCDTPSTVVTCDNFSRRVWSHAIWDLSFCREVLKQFYIRFNPLHLYRKRRYVSVSWHKYSSHRVPLTCVFMASWLGVWFLPRTCIASGESLKALTYFLPTLRDICFDVPSLSGLSGQPVHLTSFKDVFWNSPFAERVYLHNTLFICARLRKSPEFIDVIAGIV